MCDFIRLWIEDKPVHIADPLTAGREDLRPFFELYHDYAIPFRNLSTEI
jgi:hypothetical protein